MLGLGAFPGGGGAAAGGAAASPLSAARRGELRAMQEAFDYGAMVRAYADYMIEHGRDRYGEVHSPLFVSVMDRRTGEVFRDKEEVPYPHVITKPFAPGLRRDHKARPQDRHLTGANPLEDLPLYRLLFRLSEVTGDGRYAAEAGKSIDWFLRHTRNGATGLYPWGSHLHWDVHRECAAEHTKRGGSPYSFHEYNYVWPFWDDHPEALRSFAHGLWDNQIADKRTGHFSRHARYDRRGVGTGYEFPWTGSCYMEVWAREFARSGDPEMRRAIRTLLGLYRSMRDPETGAMSWCTHAGPGRREISIVEMNLFMATTVQDAAGLVEGRDPALAAEMRRFAAEIDDEFLSNDRDKILDIAGKGILNFYTTAGRRLPGAMLMAPPPGVGDASIGFPLRTDDGRPAASLSYLQPWAANRSYAGIALLLVDRHDRCAPGHKAVYREAALDAAEIYLTIAPEIQFVAYPDDIAEVVDLLRRCHALTGNAVYLRRADHVARLGVRLFFDDISPLPKLSSFDDWYESNGKNASSVELLGQMLELGLALAALPAAERATPLVPVGGAGELARGAGCADPGCAGFRAVLAGAVDEGRGGVWNGAGLDRPSAEVGLLYGREGRRRTLFVTRVDGRFSPGVQRAAALDLLVSDVVTHIPATAEAEEHNGRMDGWKGEGVFVKQHIPDAGFKDVPIHVGFLVRNDSARPRQVTLTAIYHDTWHDNGTGSVTATIAAGGSALLTLEAPARKWIRRLRLADGSGTPVTIAGIAIVMAPRSRLNPPPGAGELSSLEPSTRHEWRPPCGLVPCRAASLSRHGARYQPAFVRTIRSRGGLDLRHDPVCRDEEALRDGADEAQGRAAVQLRLCDPRRQGPPDDLLHLGAEPGRGQALAVGGASHRR